MALASHDSDVTVPFKQNEGSSPTEFLDMAVSLFSVYTVEDLPVYYDEFDHVCHWMAACLICWPASHALSSQFHAEQKSNASSFLSD